MNSTVASAAPDAQDTANPEGSDYFNGYLHGLRDYPRLKAGARERAELADPIAAIADHEAAARGAALLRALPAGQARDILTAARHYERAYGDRSAR